MFSVVVWVWSAIPSILYLLHDTSSHFNPATSDCGVHFEKKGLVNLVIAGPWVAIPFTGLIFCNVALYCIASKSLMRMGKSARQAMITLGAVSGLFVVSWLPYIVRKCFMMVTKKEMNWPLRPDILFYLLSIFGNPIIYTIVNERFKVFLKAKVISLCRPGHVNQRQNWFLSVASSNEVIKKPGSCTTLRRNVAKVADVNAEAGRRISQEAMRRISKEAMRRISPEVLRQNSNPLSCNDYKSENV